MELILKRHAYKRDYTIGRLYVVAVSDKDGTSSERYICDTLEPCCRHIASYMPEAQIEIAKKIGTTAIPRGRYKVVMSYSQKFRKFLPFVSNVKCFKGIMIHPGNFPSDTLGCILPGWNRRKGMVCASRSAMAEILDLIASAIDNRDTVTLTVREE